MSDGLDVIVVDDDPGICEVISELIESFYSWGKVHSFSDPDEAISYCLNSSRLNIMTFFGLYLLNIVSVNCFPKDPVPPVIRIVLLFNITLSFLYFFKKIYIIYHAIFLTNLFSGLFRKNFL